ncbi:MAG: hypothetical protein K2V38_23860, partial [Gemmataceae bacterium]|nr:hypothetical protein [Gemmataceae bacterium]
VCHSGVEAGPVSLVVRRRRLSMKATVLLLVAAVIVSAVVATSGTVARPPEDDAGWSKTARDIQARVTLVERPAVNGTRSLVPYLELRNVGSSADPIKVRCGDGHIKFELVDANGKVVRDGYSLPRSGTHADPGTVSLPHDSSIRVGMHCTNWGVPKDAAAMISTDSGAWVLTAEEKGKVFLRATLTAKQVESDPDRTWYGVIKLTPVKVDWGK